MSTKTQAGLSVVATIAAMLGFASTVTAEVMPPGNYSFEANVVGDGGQYGYGTINPASGWQTIYKSNETNALETYNPTSADFVGAGGNGTLPAPAAGSQCLYNASTVDDDCCVLSRTSGVNSTKLTLDAGKWYTYTVAVGRSLTLHGATYYGNFTLVVADPNVGAIDVSDFDYHNSGGNRNIPGGWPDVPAPGTFQDYGGIFCADDYLASGAGFSDGDPLRFGAVMGMQVMMDNVRISEWDTEAEARAAMAPGGIYIDANTNEPLMG
jgi:hypothetical protein